HDQGYTIQVKQSAQDILIEKGWDPKYGARPMRRAIQKELEDVLAVLILEQEYPAGTVFIAEGRDGKISIKPKRNKPTLVSSVPVVPTEPISKS
ncbi:MAG TPA: ATP-dependent Clp protease ATP-binding subunit, partial [Treponema sp.]|nr:ATP-dependent Clp protease ATP-binding subunit [Treponema sp.]HRS02775.1 ATP-dependent Clp protease ATP-binding subunit [Treponema sp.]